MEYSAQYHVFSATFHVRSQKIDFLWDTILYLYGYGLVGGDAEQVALLLEGLHPPYILQQHTHSQTLYFLF